MSATRRIRPRWAGLISLLLLTACRGQRPATTSSGKLLDTSVVARIAAHLGPGLTALRDSPAVAVEQLQQARQLNPGADAITYLLAVAHALAGDTMGLARTLDTLAARHSCLAPIEGRSFPRYETVPAVARAMRAVRDSAPALAGGRVALSLPDRTLFPEGITYDPRGGAIFLSSLRHRMVLRISRAADGTIAAAPFTVPGRDTLYSVLGMKIDTARRRLWVATAAEGFAESETPAEVGQSAIVVYDLESGRRLRRFDLPRPPNHLANDLTLDSAGTAYVTDTRAGAVYRVALDADSVETLLPPGTLAQPNGIVVTPDGHALLVADGPNGVWRVDLASRALHRLPQPPGIMPIFLDGLAIHGRSLIAIAHPLNLGWVLRFRMTAAFDSIQASEVLACNDPRLRQPTTGVVAGDTLFYVGTSQYPLIPRPGQPLRAKELVDVLVMSLPLGPS